MSKQAVLDALAATARIQSALHTIYAGWEQPGLSAARMSLEQLGGWHRNYAEAIVTAARNVKDRHLAGQWEDVA